MTRHLSTYMLVTLLAIPAIANATTVILTDWNEPGVFATNAPGGGGAFKATTWTDGVPGDSFMTFCIEYTQKMSYGTSYNAQFSDAANKGGVAGGAEDPLSAETQWLYYQARFGDTAALLQSLPNGAGGADDPIASRTGWYVQEAIWWLEGERASVGGASGINVVSHNLAQYVLNPINGVGAAWSALASDGHRVMAMNLTTPTNALVQDQLYYDRVTVPEGGTVGMMLAGFVALAGASFTLAPRRRRHSA